MQLMKTLFRLINGNYVVLEKLSYGQYFKYALRGSFYSLAHAKTFAKRLVPEFGDRVVISDGYDMNTLYVVRDENGHKQVMRVG